MVTVKGAKTTGNKSSNSVFSYAPERVSPSTFVEAFGEWLQTKAGDTNMLAYLIALYDRTTIGKAKERK